MAAGEREQDRVLGELAACQDDQLPKRATRDDLDMLCRTLRAALNHSTPDRIKPVMQALIDGICVESRDNIEPTFRRASGSR